MKLDSIQVGKAEPSPAGSLPTTAINKTSVPSAEINRAGLVDDTIVDEVNHGGPDQAVYLYTRDDYSWWESELDRPLRGGIFGENLTISGVSSADIRVGDRFAIGSDVVVEATGARIPCAVFAHAMGEPKMGPRFREARLPGVYCRVISAGVVAEGDPIEHEPAVDTVSVVETLDLFYEVKASADRLQAALDSPVGVRCRELYESRLAKRS